MSEGNLPKAPIWDDIRTLPADELPRIDIIYGGFPCQDISVAGRGAGLGGERSGLFYEIMRLVKELRPAFVFLENVPAIRTRGLDKVLHELTQERYDCRWLMLSAAEVGALHKRERWFLLGYSKHNGLAASKEQGSDGQAVCNDKEGAHETSEFKGADSSPMLANSNERRLSQERPKQQAARVKQSSVLANSRHPSEGSKDQPERTPSNIARRSEEVADTQCQGLHTGHQHKARPIARCSWFEKVDRAAQPEFRGMVDGLPKGLDFPNWDKEWEDVPRVSLGVANRVNRIKALGNSVVPIQVRMAFEILMFGDRDDKR